MGGCNGCDGCDPENMPKDEDKSWGEKVADQAITDMIKPQKEPTPAFIDADVEAFLKKCDAEKKDPIAVIEHIANVEGFKLFGERPKDDVFKEKLYDFLRAVLKSLVVGFFSYLVDKTGFGSSKLVQFMYNLMKSGNGDSSEKRNFDDLFDELDRMEEEYKLSKYCKPPVNDLVLRSDPTVRGYVFRW